MWLTRSHICACAFVNKLTLLVLFRGSSFSWRFQSAADLQWLSAHWRLGKLHQPCRLTHWPQFRWHRITCFPFSLGNAVHHLKHSLLCRMSCGRCIRGIPCRAVFKLLRLTCQPLPLLLHNCCTNFPPVYFHLSPKWAQPIEKNWRKPFTSKQKSYLYSGTGRNQDAVKKTMWMLSILLEHKCSLCKGYACGTSVELQICSFYDTEFHCYNAK